MEKDKEIDFIARRYRKGRFSTDSAWRRLAIAPATNRIRFKVAAAISATILLSATAAIIYREYRVDDMPQQAMPANSQSPLTEVKVIDFENAPLPEVVKEIESIYDIKVEGVPASPEEYVLSLHYEGTSTDLISTINDILETEMYVIEK